MWPRCAARPGNAQSALPACAQRWFLFVSLGSSTVYATRSLQPDRTACRELWRGALMAAGGMTQLLQEPSQRVQCRPKATPVPRLQAFHRLVVCVEGLLGTVGGRARERCARLCCWGRGGRGSFPEERPQRSG